MRLWLLAAIVAGLGCRKPANVRRDPVADADAPPIVRTVADQQDHPWGVAVDDTHVYWTNKSKGKGRGSLSRAEKGEGRLDGSAIEVLVESLNTPYGIALGKGRVYFSTSQPGMGGLGSVSLVDRTHIDRAMRVVSEIEEPWSIVVHGDAIFFTDLHLRRVGTAPLTASVDTSRVTTLANTSGRPVGLAVDDTHVYWSDSDPGVVSKTPISGGPITTLVARGDKTTGLAIDDAYVYWSEWGSGRIGRVQKSGGGLSILTSDQQGVRMIVVDEARIYWTHPPTGSIRSMPKQGGPITTHATDQRHPYGLAVDGTSIYWADFDGGAVRAIAKR